jgi:hypothetical protein
VTKFALYLRLYQDHRRRLRRPAIAAAVVGCTLMAAGCGPSSSSGAAGTSGAAGKSSPAATSQTPDQAIIAAADHTATITSAAATLTENVGSGQEVISGSFVEVLKPSVRVGMNLNVSASGSSEAVGAIVSDQAIWVKIAALKQETGKAWVKIPFSALNKSASSSAAVFKSLQSLNPAQQTATLTAARNVRKVGTQTVAGVPTTEYAGSIVPAEAEAKLTPALRKELAPQLKEISGNVQFSVWIDGSGYVRKEVTRESAAGKQISTTVVFTALNKPVHIAVPPASQTAVLPSSALGTAT